MLRLNGVRVFWIVCLEIVLHKNRNGKQEQKLCAANIQCISMQVLFFVTNYCREAVGKKKFRKNTICSTESQFFVKGCNAFSAIPTILSQFYAAIINYNELPWQGGGWGNCKNIQLHKLSLNPAPPPRLAPRAALPIAHW